MSRLPTLLLQCALVCLLATACGPSTGNPGVAATVNGEQIRVSEVQEDYLEQAGSEEYTATVQQVGPAAAEHQVVGTQLGQRITEILVAGALEEQGLSEPSPQEVDSRVQQIVENTPPEQLQQALQQQGLSMASLPGAIRIIMMQELIAEQLVADVEVTEEDLQTVYTQTYQFPQVSHILVETEEAAREARERIEGGEAFEDVAMEVSIDPGSAPQGGSLGQLQPGAFIPEFEEAALALGENEISEPVQTQFGYHLIRIDPPPPIEEVRDDLQSQAEDQAANRVVTDFFNELLFGADVEVNPRFGDWDPLSRSVTFADPLGGLEFAQGVEAPAPQEAPAVSPAPPPES